MIVGSLKIISTSIELSFLKKPKILILELKAQKISQTFVFGWDILKLFFFISNFEIWSSNNIMLIRKNIGKLTLLVKISMSYHNLYDVLGIDNGASQQEIKAKYY